MEQGHGYIGASGHKGISEGTGNDRNHEAGEPDTSYTLPWE